MKAEILRTRTTRLHLDVKTNLQHIAAHNQRFG